MVIGNSRSCGSVFYPARPVCHAVIGKAFVAPYCAMGISDASGSRSLGSRERAILHAVVRSFIDTAGPVGSRTLTKRFPLGISAASARNTMSDLEDLGYLRHPYTSAGRVPTQRGYRAFVDELMVQPDLPVVEKQLLKAKLDRLMGDADELFRESSRLLSQMSNLLGIVLSPRMSTGVLERLDVIPLSAPSVMIVISVRSHQVKTIIYQTRVDLRRKDIDRVVSILNERLAGLPLEDIRRTYASRTRDIDDSQTGLVQLILNGSDELFSDSVDGRLSRGGTLSLLSQPEFRDVRDVRQLMQLVEDEGYVVQLFEGQSGGPTDGKAVVSIGRELEDAHASNFSLVTAKYCVGQTVGTVGILGPTRMDYGRAIALVETMVGLLDRPSVNIQQAHVF